MRDGRKGWHLAWVAFTALWLGTGCGGDDGGGGGIGGGGAAAGSLVGVWHWEAAMSGELILQPNGQFSQTVRAGNLMTYDVGLYEVGEGFVHFAVQDHEPKEYLGRPLSYPTSFTYFFSFVSNDHIILSDRIVNTQWDAYRR